MHFPRRRRRSLLRTVRRFLPSAAMQELWKPMHKGSLRTRRNVVDPKSFTQLTLENSVFLRVAVKKFGQAFHDRSEDARPGKKQRAAPHLHHKVGRGM